MSTIKTLVLGLAILLVPMSLFNCSRTTNTSENGTPTRVENENQQMDIFEDAELMAFFRKTGCFGECPIFRVHFYDNGMAKYFGELHVPQIGKFTGTFDTKKLSQIILQAKENGFFEMADSYPIDRKLYIPDLSNTITKLVIEDQVKEINHNNDGPSELIDIENQLQKLIDNIQWKSIK